MCPGGNMSVVLGYGEFLGDIQVTRLIRMMDTAALYEAQRGKDKVLLKVAHDGCQEQLKREAAILSTAEHPMLPVLLSPYPNATVKQRPYGKTVFRDDTKYYEVFEYIDGELLRDYLHKNPQPWYQHAAWITISIADAMAYLHVKAKKLDLNLSPDVIFVCSDLDGIPRPTLLDLGVAGDIQGADINWLLRFGSISYMAPEVVSMSAPPSFASDVYSLALVQYEMLAGHPAFPTKMQKDDDVRYAVVNDNPPPLNRTDLSDDILAVVYQGIDKDPTQRQPDVRTFAKALRSKFGEVPVERKGSNVNRRIVIGLVAAAVVIAILILMAGLIG
jgi:serine/threonine protein kinase